MATVEPAILSHYETALTKAVVATDWLEYQTVLTEYLNYRRQVGLAVQVASVSNLLALCVKQRLVAALLPAQLKILNSLLSLHCETFQVHTSSFGSEVNADLEHILELACLHSSWAVIKVLLALGITISFNLLETLLRHSLYISHSCLAEIIVNLISYSQLDLGWLFNCGMRDWSEHTNGVFADGYDDGHHLTHRVCWSDHNLVTRTVLLQGLDDRPRDKRLLLGYLEEAQATNTITILVRLGLLDDQASQYLTAEPEVFTFLTPQLISIITAP